MNQQYVWWAFGTKPTDTKVSSTAYEAVGKYLAYHNNDTYMYPAVIIQGAPHTSASLSWHITCYFFNSQVGDPNGSNYLQKDRKAWCHIFTTEKGVWLEETDELGLPGQPGKKQPH